MMKMMMMIRCLLLLECHLYLSPHNLTLFRCFSLYYCNLEKGETQQGVGLEPYCFITERIDSELNPFTVVCKGFTK